MRTPESVLAEMDALFPEPPDLSILGDSDVPIEEQMSYVKVVTSANSEAIKTVNANHLFVNLTQELGMMGEVAIPCLLENLNHRKAIIRGFIALPLVIAATMDTTTKQKLPLEKRSSSYSLVLEALLERLHVEKNSQAKSMVIASLGMLGDERAVEPLLELLQSPITYFRDWDNHEATPLEKMQNMKTLLEGEKFDGRHSVVRALGEIGDKRAIEPLMELLDRDLSQEMSGFLGHWTAAVALGNFEDVRAIVPLQRCLAYYQNGGRHSLPEECLTGTCETITKAITKLATSTEGEV
jgi:PBS lyase HEAT-like repeat